MRHFMARDVRTAPGDEASRCDNRSLSYLKFPDLSLDPQDKEARKRSIQQMISRKADPEGLKARSEFLHSLKGCGYRSEVIFARLQGRLIVNQAGGVIENAGLCLDPHFGMPYIPGSTLKGISRAAARNCGAEPREIHAVFGWSANDGSLPEPIRKTSYAGSVSFLPAYPINDAPLVMDILTCHHPEYYRDATKARALDTESPIPNLFPVVEVGAQFAVALVILNRETRTEMVRAALDLPRNLDLLHLAKTWLLEGLTQLGVGAKTVAGYGWFIHDQEAEERRKAEESARLEAEESEKRRREEQQRRREEEEKRIAAMNPVDRIREQLLRMGDEEFAGFARGLAGKTLDEQRAFVLTLRQEKKDRWKTWRRKKPELAQAIQSIANIIGEALP